MVRLKALARVVDGVKLDLESQAFVSQWFIKPGEVLVRTTKEEKVGRMLADCTRAGEPSLCSELLERGLAGPYTP